MENKDGEPTNGNEQPRSIAAVRSADDRFVALRENEKSFLRAQVEKKDEQISALLDRDKETNTLIHRLQAMLAPLLVAPSDRRNDSADAMDGQ
jgi:hypothetical protein